MTRTKDLTQTCAQSRHNISEASGCKCSINQHSAALSKFTCLFFRGWSCHLLCVVSCNVSAQSFGLIVVAVSGDSNLHNKAGDCVRASLLLIFRSRR